MLKFSEANAKTKLLAKVPQLRNRLAGGNKVYSFDLLAGWSCPFAKECLSKVVNGKIEDGPHTLFRCFAASIEAAYTNVYKLHEHNYHTLRKLDFNGMVRELDRAIPDDMGICRIHASGEFFNMNYFRAWIEIARKYKYILFYSYTKALPYWLMERESVNELSNFILTASYGGTYDHLITAHNLRSAKVVFSKHAARKLGLAIDHNDSHAATPGGNFALLLHGIQPANTPASVALRKLKGVGSYHK